MKKRLISALLVLLLIGSLLPSALAENDPPVAAGTFSFHQYAVYDVSMT